MSPTSPRIRSGSQRTAPTSTGSSKGAPTRPSTTTERASRESFASSRAKVLATNQPYAKALTLAPPYLYWATFDDNSNTSSLVRVKADCQAPCTADVVGNYAAHISRLVAVGTTDLIALGEDGGKLVHFSLAADGGVSTGITVLTSTNLPGMAVTTTHAYVSGLLTKSIGRAEVSGVAKIPAWASLALDAGGTANVGIANLATDCKNLFGMHGPDLVQVTLGGAAVALIATAVSPSAFDMVADAKYVYVASLNGYGVIAVDTTSAAQTQLANGQSVVAIAVDSRGVYWGEHGFSGGGTIMMLEK